MMPQQLERFFQNIASAQERGEVIDWLLDPQNDVEIRSWLNSNWDQVVAFTTDAPDVADPDIEKIWTKIKSSIDGVASHQRTLALPIAVSSVAVSTTAPTINVVPATSAISRKNRFFSRIAVAAVSTGMLMGISYFFLPQSSRFTTPLSATIPLDKPDIAPPRDARAELTLADGSMVFLDSTVNGMLAKQGDVAVRKNEKGEIIYTGKATVVSYNTLSIPRGSKPIRLVLADGSLVWLNAASSLTYPTAFLGNERKVSMTGEAYFEVAKQNEVPFFVEQGNLSIEVLGTHFNVKSDVDEKNSRVTLLEGSVKVSVAEKTVSIVPGQQAFLNAATLKIVDGVDTEEVMAWKNGQFFFTGTGIREIMKQLVQHYDVQVEFKDEVPYQFVAKISRDVNVSTFLEKLELTNLIHFKIEEKKIIVMK